MMMLIVFPEVEALPYFQSCSANFYPVTPTFCSVFLKVIFMFSDLLF